jgi:outer membrane lipoprotein carrier protein
MNTLISIWRVILLSGLLLGLPLAKASQSTEQLSVLLSSYQSLSAKFSQKIIDEYGTVMQEATGDLAIRRPNQLRWYTNAPTQQLIVADGEKLWIYDIDLEQVTIESVQRLVSSGPAMLLTGAVDRLQQHFTITTQQNNTHQQFKLTPKEKDDLVQWIELDFVGGKIHHMRLMSQLSQITVLDFDQVKLNPTLRGALFYFKLPDDVDVIDNSTT